MLITYRVYKHIFVLRGCGFYSYCWKSFSYVLDNYIAHKNTLSYYLALANQQHPSAFYWSLNLSLNNHCCKCLMYQGWQLEAKRICFLSYFFQNTKISAGFFFRIVNGMFCSFLTAVFLLLQLFWDYIWIENCTSGSGDTLSSPVDAIPGLGNSYFLFFYSIVSKLLLLFEYGRRVWPFNEYKKYKSIRKRCIMIRKCVLFHGKVQTNTITCVTWHAI